MDKEPTISAVSAWALVGAAVGFLACRSLHWALAIAGVVVASSFPLAVVMEVHDPQVGPAIIREAGLIYAVLAYFSLGVVLAASIMGLYLRLRRRRH